MTSSNDSTASNPYSTFELFDNGRKIFRGEFEGSYPDRINGSVTLPDGTRRIILRKHLNLVSTNYKEIYYENARRIVKTASPSDANQFCHYEGVVDGDHSSYVTVNLCNEHITGTVYIDDTHYVMDNFRLIPSANYYAHESSSFICGDESKLTKVISGVYARRKRALNTKPSYYKKFVNWKDLYVELAIVFDNSMYKKYGPDKKRLFERAKDLANFINAYYQPIRIKIALAGVEIWSESDRVVVNTSGDATLDQFLRYRKVNLIHDIPNDHAQLLTNFTFSGGVVGKAMKGTMCSTELSGAVVIDHDRFKSVAPIAATMAHEMGHNFGMEHDNDACECPQQRCLMAASSSGAGNTFWSACSLEYLSWNLAHGADYCLRNKPATAKEPVCGNGFVEDGEECDCGLPDVCDNPCCNASNCRFISGAICASGECCDLSKCHFMPLATVCRNTKTECDLPEYCNGKSETCPVDTYKHDGIACKGSQGFCYNGTCGTHDDQCKLIWGSTGQKAPQICYTLNVKGSLEGHCGFDRNRPIDQATFRPCELGDAMCGLLQCEHRTERSNYGDRSVVRLANTVLHTNDKVVNCHAANIDLGLNRPDPGMVPNGAKCGDGKMCVKQKCLPVSTVMSDNTCPSDCHDSGVCNNFGHCHCANGYGGIDCSIPGLGGSIDSGPASTGVGRFNVGIGILVFLLLVLPLITAVVTILYKKRVIKAPRFKVIDLLFKPRVSKNRPLSSARSDISQTRARLFDPSTTCRQAAPILAYSANSSNSPPIIWPMSTVTDNHAQAELDQPPQRPPRPSDEILEKLYYTDVGITQVEVTTAQSVDPGTSLLCDVLTALDPEDEYGPAIVPQRRAPPPPIQEESGQQNGTVKEKKRIFEGKQQTKENDGGSKQKVPNRRLTLTISEPREPKISGEFVDQSSSLVVVPHVVSQTLPRKKHSDTALSTSAAYPAREWNQRKSSMIEQNRPMAIFVQRSHSTVSSARPTTAPPPPPPPPKTMGLKLMGSKRDPASISPLVSKEDRESEEEYEGKPGKFGKRRSSSTLTENYYDVIGSPIDEGKEEIYADIDEIRASIQAADKETMENTGNTQGAPNYRTLHPSRSKGALMND